VFLAVTFDASYPTGGYALTAASLGFVTLDTVDAASLSNLGSRLCGWNQATGKLQVYSALGTEVANTTDLHLDGCLVEAVGR
jgi:hypothetical protein